MHYIQKKLLAIAVINVCSLFGMNRTILIKQPKEYRETLEQMGIIQGKLIKLKPHEENKKEECREKLHLLAKKLGKIKVEEIVRKVDLNEQYFTDYIEE